MVTNKIVCLALVSFLFISMPVTHAQGFDSERRELAAFLTRMYSTDAFEGVRVVKDYDNSYLLSVISLDPSKYPNQSSLNRVASVKAMSEANRFFNGSKITSDLVIKTSTSTTGGDDVEIIERINERSIGYVRELQLLTTIDDTVKGRKVFIFYKLLPKE